jgi:hypothetical protein
LQPRITVLHRNYRLVQNSFRAPRHTCTLKASNDYEAVQAWLSLHESAATQRAYRKEAERLILWAIVERGCALSSLTTDDAIAYRGFLRRPAPRERWIGPSRPRSNRDRARQVVGLARKGQQGGGADQGTGRSAATRSTAYALSVLGALFRWLIAQRYVLANPFAGIKVRGHTRATAMDASRGFAEGAVSGQRRYASADRPTVQIRQL